MNHRKVYKLNSNNNLKGFNTLQKKTNSVFHTIEGRHRILNLWVSIFPKSARLQQLVLLILKRGQLVLLTILAEEAVREAKLARALIRISPTVVGE